jgi:hypothetical protein
MGRLKMYRALYKKEMKSIRGITVILVVAHLLESVVHGMIQISMAYHWYEDKPQYHYALISFSRLLGAYITGPAPYMFATILLYMFVREYLSRTSQLERSLPVRNVGHVLCRFGAVATAGGAIALISNIRWWYSFYAPLLYWRTTAGTDPSNFPWLQRELADKPELMAQVVTTRIFPLKQVILDRILHGHLFTTMFGKRTWTYTAADLSYILLLCACIVFSVGITRAAPRWRIVAGLTAGIVLFALIVGIADPFFTELPLSLGWGTRTEFTTYFAIWTAILLAAGTALIARYGEE